MRREESPFSSVVADAHSKFFARRDFIAGSDKRTLCSANVRFRTQLFGNEDFTDGRKTPAVLIAIT
jgi:hypothetical protein